MGVSFYLAAGVSNRVQEDEFMVIPSLGLSINNCVIHQKPPAPDCQEDFRPFIARKQR
jgi:hypothetical protein